MKTVPQKIQKIRILLVEDDIESGQAMTAMLTRRGLDVQLVATAEAAISAFDTGTYDAVVTDIRLGDRTGIDVLDHIRRKDLLFPVILLTGYEDMASAIQAVRLNAQDYILKPLERIDNLIKPIEKAVRQFRTEQQLKEYREKLRALTMEVVLAEEKERHRMAVDLHDYISQSLAVLKIRFDLLAQNPKYKDFGKDFTEISATLDSTLQGIRNLTFQLCPPTLYELGLPPALAELAQVLRKAHRMDIEFKANADNISLPRDLQILMFRSARELMMNVIKHAKVTRMKLAVARRDGQVVVTVEDNGRGFDAEQKTNKGIGLFSIAERMRYVGGTFTIVSTPGKGTRAVISVPDAGPSTDRRTP